jgi:prepilin peptidase CpaA
MQELYAMIDLLVMLVTNVRVALLFALLTVAACIDWRTRRIPNQLVVAGIAIALACSIAFPVYRGYGLSSAVEGLLFAFLATIPLYAMRVMGAGDVKLITMVGAFTGWPEMPYVLVSIFIAGGAIAVIHATRHRLWSRLAANFKAGMQHLLVAAATGTRPVLAPATSSAGKLPYALSIATGTVGYLVLQQFGYLS